MVFVFETINAWHVRELHIFVIRAKKTTHVFYIIRNAERSIQFQLEFFPTHLKNNSVEL